MISKTTDRTTQRVAGGGRTPLRLGFVPLIDAAPLIAAAELGFFANESIAVTLQREIGWGNVRDKLTFGQLDASHALLGMPLASQLGWEWFSEPLVSLMTLATGGNAVTLSKGLVGRGVTTATDLAAWIRSRGGAGQPPVRLAHVFGCSSHHYLLRMWLESGGVDPDRDVTLCVVPPPQMGWQIGQECLDGFCVGEPWNTLAQRDGHGTVVAATVDLLPDHPEKVLAVSRHWLVNHGDLAEPLVRAVLRGCAYCHDPANHAALAELLARKAYLGLPAQVIVESLAFAGPTDPKVKPATVRPTGWHPRSFDPAGTFPSATHMAWLLDRMVRAGHAAVTEDPLALTRRCCDPSAYRRAARSLGVAVPPNDLPPMRLRTGTYDPLSQRRNQHRHAATGA